MVGVDIVAISGRLLVALVSNADDSEVGGKVRIGPIRTDRCCDVNSLSLEVGQHLLEVHAHQVDRVPAHGARFVADVRIRISVESADEPAVVGVDASYLPVVEIAEIEQCEGVFDSVADLELGGFLGSSTRDRTEERSN